MLESGNIERAAAEWVAREDRGLSADQALALSAWLDAAIAHRVAYLRIKAGWQRTERLAALRAGDVADVTKFLSRYHYAIAAAIVVAVLGAAFVIYIHVGSQLSETYVARNGEHPIVRLSDGTRIQLNKHTQVQARVTGSERTVTLERGEAYFDVVHDAKRPFVVYAGNRRITDLGTKFSVQRVGDDVRVIVTEGRVRVDTLNTPMSDAPVFAGQGNVVMSKGDETLVAPKDQKDIDNDLSWRTGMLTFNQATLADAAQQFNRFNTRKIVVEGESRNVRISGSFRADNIDVFSQLVKNALGFKVTQTQNQITISH